MDFSQKKWFSSKEMDQKHEQESDFMAEMDLKWKAR